MKFELKGENEKRRDKYSNLAIKHLIENLPFWPRRRICGLNEGEVLSKVNVEDPSEESHYRDILI